MTFSGKSVHYYPGGLGAARVRARAPTQLSGISRFRGTIWTPPLRWNKTVRTQEATAPAAGDATRPVLRRGRRFGIRATSQRRPGLPLSLCWMQYRGGRMNGEPAC